MLRPEEPGDIIEFSKDITQLRLGSGELVAILRCPPESGYSHLCEALKKWAGGRFLGRNRVVVLGGKNSVEQALEEAQPGAFNLGELRVHHFREDGTWWHGPGKETSPQLSQSFEKALRQVRSERFDDGNFMAALSQALERGREHSNGQTGEDIS